MKELRQKMIDLMTVKNFSPRTHESYLYSMISLVSYYHQPPDELTQEDIQNYLIYLMKDRQLAPATCRLQLNGIRFFFKQVLKWPTCQLTMHYPSRPQRIPELLSRSEVKAILNGLENLKHQTLLKTCYGAGLRVSELVALRVSDIDSERHFLRVEQGKGARDRLVPLSPMLLSVLREYWQHYRPSNVLFYNQTTLQSNSISCAGKVFNKAKKRAGIIKVGGIHSLRHAYATHQLEYGVPMHLLQRWLGHQDIRTTMRYVHWVPEYTPRRPDCIDLLDL
jgi:integrase/recombinase XerD